MGAYEIRQMKFIDFIDMNTAPATHEGIEMSVTFFFDIYIFVVEWISALTRTEQTGRRVDASADA